ncbi:MAG: AbrB family transcriptional regulator [Clostridiales bacterium 43-6]|nr:MAG: AbrB family transcriptional regulator [Clostridiales bacterium 43-6]
MTATGIERKLDELGRVVLPKELRNTMHLATGTPMRIYVEGNRIILEKGSHACAICGDTQNVKEINGKEVCQNCITAIKEQG